MNYPSGGFPAQGPQQPQQGPPPGQHYGQHAQSGGGADMSKLLPLILALATAVLGLVIYFLTFSDSFGFGDAAMIPIVAGLLAALAVVPKGPKTLPFAAMFSVLGFMTLLAAVINAPSVPGVLTVGLIVSILQLITGVAAYLFGAEIIKLPAGGPPAQGQYGQPGPYGQQPPGGMQQQPQQPTQYASSQGQFGQQQPPPPQG